MVFAGVFMMITPQQAIAAGTASDTNINNRATINYQISGVAQTLIESSPTGNSTPGAGAGTDTTFKVDNKVDLTVAEVSLGYTDVNPNTTDQVLTFTVSNTGNTVQDFALAAAANVTDPFGGTENFDANTVRVFVEEGTSVGFQLLEDKATFIDELGPYVNPGDEVTVYVVADIPIAQVNGDIAAYTLTATARAGGSAGGTVGDALVETAGADTAGVDIVFADAAGDTDNAREADHSDSDAYRILSAQLTINKSSTVIRDPFNLDTNPKHIPGAYIRYVITVSNGAPTSATLTTITDTLDSNTAIDPDLIVAATGLPESIAGSGFRVDLVGTTRSSQGTPQYFTTASDADGVEHAGSIATATMATVLPVDGIYTVGELKQNESVTLTFNVIIQ